MMSAENHEQETGATSNSQPTYYAIGLPQGVLVDSNQSEEPFGNIRRGGKTVMIPFAAYQWWVLALDGVGVDTFRDLAAKQNEMEDFSDNLAWMVESRLLLPWTGENGDIERFPEIRVLPAGVGVGNSRDDPVGFVILSRRGDPSGLRVDIVGYIIWMFLDGVVTLEQACQATAEHAKVPVEDVRQRALTLVPTLMRNGLALLDVVGVPENVTPCDGNPHQVQADLTSAKQ